LIWPPIITFYFIGSSSSQAHLIIHQLKHTISIGYGICNQQKFELVGANFTNVCWSTAHFTYTMNVRCYQLWQLVVVHVAYIWYIDTPCLPTMLPLINISCCCLLKNPMMILIHYCIEITWSKNRQISSFYSFETCTYLYLPKNPTP
jgi:hypothetical protein